MDPLKTVNAALNTIGKVVDYFKTNIAGHVQDSSLTQMTKLTRAEPLTIISQDCMNYENLPAVMNTLASIYSGYFLQAVSMLTTINNVEVVKVLDALNPNRDSTGFLLQGRMSKDTDGFSFASENYKHSLPTRRIVQAMEELNRQQDTIKVLYEMENLAVGKLLNVDITVPGEVDNKTGLARNLTVTVPITVRLAPSALNEESLVYIFKHHKDNDSIVERYHSWRAGRISLIRDMILCQDLITEYRRAALKDKSGTLQEMTRRANANRAYGLLTKNPSLAISTNLYVISKQAAETIEANVGYKFNSAQGREKIFQGTYAMIIAVLDTEREMITFYFNGIAQPSVMSIRAIKSSGKKGPDVGDIMRVLLEGRAPTF